MNECNENIEKKHTRPGKYSKSGGNKKRNTAIGVVCVVIIIIIIILLLRCCGNGSDVIPLPTIGDFDITDGRQETTLSDQVYDIPTITFVGRGEYYVSEDSPKIELRNSEKNEELGAEMIFTVMDARSGDVIARTPKIKPGQYVYVNVMEYYAEIGTYDIVVNISATGKNGEELNSMNQEAKLYVQNK